MSHLISEDASNTSLGLQSLHQYKLKDLSAKFREIAPIIQPSEPDSADLVKSSPFNIAWKSKTDDELTAAKVAEEFREDGWTNDNPLVQGLKTDQYIKTNDGDYKDTDQHVMKPGRQSPNPTNPDSTYQYHIRLYDAPDSANVDVIGQAHWDPIGDHGKLRDNPNYKLNEARNEAVNFWEKEFEDGISIEAKNVENTMPRFASHDGQIQVINVEKEGIFSDGGSDGGGMPFPVFPFSSIALLVLLIMKLLVVGNPKIS
ncbi:MAG: hypothetical protein GVY17_00015 [Cyanobacteria bacterium]|jgi:hypothetical protein|nr:hypothetical protein [Cyanobacteria bacterium GSL.Bin21]